jgi:hypothetical protein
LTEDARADEGHRIERATPLLQTGRAMRKSSDRSLRAYFLGWQCRIRQMAVRQFAGAPTPAMHPQLSTKDGCVISPAVTVLLVPEHPGPSTAFFKFQIQKTNEPGESREAALHYLAANYFQIPENFSDETTAVFVANSPIAACILRAKSVVLDFEQYAQRFRVVCSARLLNVEEPAREATFWQARLFNQNLRGDVEVLAFKPDWKKSAADPEPVLANVENRPAARSDGNAVRKHQAALTQKKTKPSS